MLQQLKPKAIVNEGYELDGPERFTFRQREWVKARDLCPHSPVIDDYGNLIDLDLEHVGNVHHIHMIDHVKRFQYGVNPNTPVNAFYIGKAFHTSIHRDWVEPLKEEYLAYSKYMSFEEYVRQETWTGKRAYWLSAYDWALNNMAIVNSYEFLDRYNCDFPFGYQDYEMVLTYYPLVEDKFKSQYARLKEEYGIVYL